MCMHVCVCVCVHLHKHIWGLMLNGRTKDIWLKVNMSLLPEEQLLCHLRLSYLYIATNMNSSCFYISCMDKIIGVAWALTMNLKIELMFPLHILYHCQGYNFFLCALVNIWGYKKMVICHIFELYCPVCCVSLCAVPVWLYWMPFGLNALQTR